MAIRTPEDIDFSTFPDSDGQPMAETHANAVQMVDLQWTLQTLFARQGRAATTAVGGNQFVYYNPSNGRDNISPDVYVIFDRPPPVPPKWQTWVEGKFPDIVFEITSPSTEAQDLSVARGGKRRLYAEQGAREYYIYDPQQVMVPPLLGYESRGDRMEPLSALPSGGVWSPLLGVELRPLAMPETQRRPAGVWLRVIDPWTGRPIPIAEEEHDELQAARQQLTAEERARLIAERRAVAEEQARLAADQARLAADQRAQRAEAELQALRAALTGQKDTVVHRLEADAPGDDDV